MKLNLKHRFDSLISAPERLLRMTLFTLLYAFMNVATQLTIEDRVALNPFYNLFLSVGFIFGLLFTYGTFMKYYQDKNADGVYKRYEVDKIL